MAYNYIKTGPFKLEQILNDDQRYLKLQFDDLNSISNRKNERKLSKVGNWPSSFSETLLAKATPYIGKKVYVITSQTTKNWSSEEWLCDISSIEDTVIKEEVGSKIKAADGSSNLATYLARCGKYLIDYSITSSFFSKEEEYEDFWKSLEREFEASWRTQKTARKISDNIKRIRIKGLNQTSKRNGYRVVVWNVDEFNNGQQYFVILKVDSKLENEEWLTNSEISKIKNKVIELESNYSDGKLEKILIAAYEDMKNNLPPIKQAPIILNETKIYLNCPFSEKDDCKNLGGKWDNEAKKWYFTNIEDKQKFAQWLN